MIPSNSSPRFPSATAAVHQQVPEQNQSGSSPSANLKPSYGDDDEIYIILRGSDVTTFKLREDVFEKLSRDHPGIFDGINDPKDLNNLLSADPVRFQPLAKLLADNDDHSASFFESTDHFNKDNFKNIPSLYTEKISYGLYKHGCYKIIDEFEGPQWLETYPERYEAMKKNKLHISQLREFLFDQSISDSDKVAKLQLLFRPISPGEEEITVEELLENTEFLIGDTFKEDQKRAIEHGLRP